MFLCRLVNTVPTVMSHLTVSCIIAVEVSMSAGVTGDALETFRPSTLIKGK